MKLTITTASNGYVIESEDYTRLVSGDDPVRNTFQLLWEVLEAIGHVGSRYDERRVRVVIEPGDKWVSPEELAAEVGEGAE